MNFTPNCMRRLLVFMKARVRKVKSPLTGSEALRRFSGMTPVTRAGVFEGKKAKPGVGCDGNRAVIANFGDLSLTVLDTLTGDAGLGQVALAVAAGTGQVALLAEADARARQEAGG